MAVTAQQRRGEFKGKRSENRFKDGAYWLEQREAAAEKYRKLKSKLAL